jgi:hypothetical protein
MIRGQPNHPTAVRTLVGVILASALALAFAPHTAAAQTLRGRVLDSELGHPIAGATVRVRGGRQPATTDTLGWFEARDLPGADVELTIDALGYARGTFRVVVPPSGVLDQDFALDFTGHRLPEVVVRGRVEQLAVRYKDFELRRQRKLGAFLRWDELIKRGSNTVGDAIRTVRGVRIQCDQASFECYAVMSRSPQCSPVWWIDGVEVRSFHENTPIRDVYGIEIYRGPGEVPGEFGGSNAACGVIVMWTKSRPYR